MKVGKVFGLIIVMMLVVVGVTVTARAHIGQPALLKLQREALAGPQPVKGAALDGLVEGSCRYGIAAWRDQVAHVGDFGAGWFLDFYTYGYEQTSTPEYVPTIRVTQNKDGDGNYLEGYTTEPLLSNAEGELGWWIQQYPGAIWIVGNEPERGPDPDGTPSNQDDATAAAPPCRPGRTRGRWCRDWG